MKLYNSLTRKKEDFTPLEEGVVRMYNCGPTVYNYFHIGNARNFVIFDTLRKYLIYRGYKVIYVQNFTDVDDKMITRCQTENIPLEKLSEEFIREYYIDARNLGIMEADFSPRATECIDDIIRLIKTLIEKGYAYEVDGDVYFDTLRYKEYGKLSGFNREHLLAGARVETDERKKDAADFALWKKEKPSEPSWNSPWGKGRPGWHIECSAMSMKYLGDTIDIHSGGDDLKFPHHENEIAQSEAATGKPFARFWLHNGFINVDNEKMSKSLGNFFTIRDIAKKFDHETLRFFLISAHYRSPVNFSDKLLEQCESGLFRMYECLRNLSFLITTAKMESAAEEEALLLNKLHAIRERFISHMDDDLNTADAISDIFDIVKEANLAMNDGTLQSRRAARQVITLIKELGSILGILMKETKVIITEDIRELLAKREKARLEKDYPLSDEIRNTLKDMGIGVEDAKDGQKVRYL
ncbi:MAG: cysteine--tRNA ligase [Clostridia bacterium]